MAEDVKHVNGGELEELLNKKPLVLVDFWAEWCMPCRFIEPIFEEIARTYKEVTCVKVNVDENQESAAKYGVMGIPTLILFKNGKPVERIVGVAPKEQIEQQISLYL